MNQTQEEAASQRILVIRTGGIGPFTLALNGFAALRMHHDGAEIELLAAPDLRAFAAASPYFDRVCEAELPPRRQIWQMAKLGRWLRARHYDRIYDLDGTAWTSALYKSLLTWRQRFGLDPKPAWSGEARGCALPHSNPSRHTLHETDRILDQLNEAGVEERPPATVAWASRAVDAFRITFDLGTAFTLIAPDPPGNRRTAWPADRIADLARAIAERGRRPVLVGETRDPAMLEEVTALVPDAVDLCGRASHVELVFLAWAADAAAGLDNGVMHLIAAAGCRSVVLYGPGSDPALNGHRGPGVMVLRRHELAAITAWEVAEALDRPGAA